MGTRHLDAPDADGPTVTPIAARAIRNAAALGLDPRRVAVALGVDTAAVTQILRAPAESGGPEVRAGRNG